MRRGCDAHPAHQSSGGGCPLKTAINGAMQPAVLLMMRYWPPPMLAGALFQNPLENLVIRQAACSAQLVAPCPNVRPNPN